MLAKIALATTMTLFLAVTQTLGQCQNQTCVWNNSSRCYTCQSGFSYYCNVRGKCAQECTEGHCGAAAANTLGASSACEQFDSNVDTSVDTSAVDSLDAPTAPQDDALTELSQIRIEGSPAVIVESVHGAAELLKSLVIKNVGAKSITQYQLGYLIVSRDAQQEPRVVLLDFMPLPVPLNSGETTQVGAQRVPGTLLSKANRGIYFFIAGLKFGDGSFYAADQSKITQQTAK